MIQILEPGLQATVQDLGRVGYGHLGVPEAGALDPESLRLANRLVGNPEGAAGVEFLLGGLAVRFHVDRAFALTGAPVGATLDEKPVAFGAWVYAVAGQVLCTTRPTFGLRTYLAVAGGVAIDPVFGSRSTDTLSNLGPETLGPGHLLPVGVPGPAPPCPDVAVSRSVARPGSLDLNIRLGPRDDLFPAATLALLASARWEISHETDRTAARLLGPSLLTEDAAQLPTEGLPAGAIQVPPSGKPILHLANHPPTGGYPIIAVVDREQLGQVAQAVPGTAVRFLVRTAVSLHPDSRRSSSPST